MHKIRKQNFVLLELLIAFALVSLALIPLLRYPSECIKSEVDELFLMELQLDCNAHFAKLKAEFSRNEHPHQRLFNEEKEVEEDEIKVQLSKHIEREFLRKTSFRRELHGIGENASRVSLTNLHVVYYPKGKRGGKSLLICDSYLIAQKNS